MAKINWERDWAKAPVYDLALAVSVLANATGGVEQSMLEQASEELYRLGSLEK